MSNSIVIAPPPAVQTILKSNLPPEQKKTQIRAWYDSVMAKAIPTKEVATTMVEEAVDLARADIVGVLTGLALGWAESRLGTLDLGRNKDIPVDGLLAGASGLGALLPVMRQLGISTDVRIVSAVSAGIMAQRKAKAHFDESKTSAVHGQDPNAGDPLLQWAKSL